MSAFELVDDDDLALLRLATTRLAAGFRTLPAVASTAGVTADTMQQVLCEVAERMHNNYPYAHPLYAGQMLKPPHPVARAAYQMAMWINPNNHALDGGRASSALEKEAVAEIAAMFGLSPFLGHLSSSGTIANLEALWIAGEERPGKRIAASADAHYTHARLSSVLKLPFTAIETDAAGRLSLEALERAARHGDLGTVVATAGTTSFAAVDPIDDILAMAREYDFRVHVDAAYGGYFGLADTTAEIRRHFSAIAGADSVAIDPHKHGLQPYGCGCVLFADPAVGRHYRHDSPYTYFSSDELHLGEISLECSRAGAAATALWATQRLLPLTRDGAFAASLNRCLAAAGRLAAFLDQDERYHLIQRPSLDIVVWAVNARSLSAASALAQAVFDEAARRDLHLALIDVRAERLGPKAAAFIPDQSTVTCLRSCLMKPEHLDWVNEIVARLSEATDAASA